MRSRPRAVKQTRSPRERNQRLSLLLSWSPSSIEKIDPQVQSILRERYPLDQATGFRPGDLRGAISVRVPLP